MENEKIVRTIVDKCRIYYQDSLISGESIIEKYLHFFAKQFDSSKRSVNFAFHTGSPCFNIAAAASIVIGCLAYELSSNDDILRDLEIDQMVLYKGERYRWGGIELYAFQDNPPIDYVTLKQDAKGKNGPSSSKIRYEQNKHLIKPYYGTSTGTDGRGVRKDTSNRNNFISFILGIPETDVPTTIDVSVVVVADKQRLIDMCKNLRIEYGDGKSVMITDIAPVAYYTASGEEIQVHKNQSFRGSRPLHLQYITKGLFCQVGMPISHRYGRQRLQDTRINLSCLCKADRGRRNLPSNYKARAV